MDNSKFQKYDLSYPGRWIGGEDRDWAFETQHILNLIEDELTCAVASFSKFMPITINDIEFIRSQSKYERAFNTIYAHSFIYSLDSISKLLSVLNNQTETPEGVRKLITQYIGAFGNLKHIRDSVAHIEDRGRGLDKNKKPLSAKILVLGAMNGSRIEYTANDGNRYGVDISEATLQYACEILQNIINKYVWE